MKKKTIYLSNFSENMLFSKVAVLLSLLILFSISQVQAQVFPDIARVLVGGTPEHGIKIKTNIPFESSADMVSLEIKGYSYGLTAPLDLHLCFYLYFNSDGQTYVYRPVISSSGGHTPTVQIGKEDNKVFIFIDEKVYYQKLYLNAFSGFDRPQFYTNWQIVDEARAGSNIVDATYMNRFRGDIFFPFGTWASGGNVGIGTEFPTEKLSVKGNIRAQEVKFETANWPDYVFEDDYQLPSLTETATFIEKNKHLPGVPKAADIAEDGLSWVK